MARISRNQAAEMRDVLVDALGELENYWNDLTEPVVTPDADTLSQLPPDACRPSGMDELAATIFRAKEILAATE